MTNNENVEAMLVKILQALTSNPTRFGNAPKETYSTSETAVLLGVSKKTVYRLMSRGRLRAIAALRTKLIPRREIERFLDETK